MTLNTRPTVWMCTLTFLVANCRSGIAPAPAPDWQIVPGQRFGAFDSASTHKQLVEFYGDTVVQTMRIELGEGETAPGTVLFPADSLRRLEILWQDTVARARPARLVLRGSRSGWRLPRGISLGTSLRQLEQENGRQFTLAGFGWDYGGAIVDWGGGSLASDLPGVILYVGPGPDQRETSAYREVLGDRDYRSSLPAMQTLDPRIYQIYVDFR